jgi:endo-1,4-beta-xylanase
MQRSLRQLLLALATGLSLTACGKHDVNATAYPLTIVVNGNGTASPAAGTHFYVAGTSVIVTATAASGATFTGWSGAATGTANPVTITMSAALTLTASFGATTGWW